MKSAQYQGFSNMKRLLLVIATFVLRTSIASGSIPNKFHLNFAIEKYSQLGSDYVAIQPPLPISDNNNVPYNVTVYVRHETSEPTARLQFKLVLTEDSGKDNFSLETELGEITLKDFNGQWVRDYVMPLNAKTFTRKDNSFGPISHLPRDLILDKFAWNDRVKLHLKLFCCFNGYPKKIDHLF